MKFLFFLFLMTITIGNAQNNSRFSEEVRDIQQKYDTLWNSSKETIVFTGSSSIRLWKNLPLIFPNHQIINTGFGGSVSADLLLYTKQLILNYHPKQVFIYEGDNDISGKKKPKEVIQNLKKIIQQIKQQDATTKIVLIAAKPSITRWHLKKEYKKLNKQQKRLCKKDSSLYYADVWSIMLKKKKLNKTLFSADGLHMNQQGYKLWENVMRKFIN